MKPTLNDTVLFGANRRAIWTTQDEEVAHMDYSVDGHNLHIKQLVVAQGHRNQGLFSNQLLEQIVSLCRQHGCARGVFRVAGGSAAEEIFRKFGSREYPDGSGMVELYAGDVDNVLAQRRASSDS